MEHAFKLNLQRSGDEKLPLHKTVWENAQKGSQKNAVGSSNKTLALEWTGEE